MISVCKYLYREVWGVLLSIMTGVPGMMEGAAIIGHMVMTDLTVSYIIIYQLHA